MKTVKLCLAIISIALASSLSAQTAKPAETTSKYFVQVPHTPDQCMTMLTDMKDKGDSYLSKFSFGCMSGDHTAYAFIDGKSEDDVRQMLPKEVQASAKIVKVDKFTSAQIKKMHEDHTQKN
jgi:hypothetical protein